MTGFGEAATTTIIGKDWIRTRSTNLSGPDYRHPDRRQPLYKNDKGILLSRRGPHEAVQGRIERSA
jgi:hypothetical protein